MSQVHKVDSFNKMITGVHISITGYVTSFGSYYNCIIIHSRRLALNNTTFCDIQKQHNYSNLLGEMSHNFG